MDDVDNVLDDVDNQEKYTFSPNKLYVFYCVEDTVGIFYILKIAT